MAKDYSELHQLIEANEGRKFHIDYLFRIERGRLWFYSDSFYTWVPVKLSDLNTFEILALIETLKGGKEQDDNQQTSPSQPKD